MASYHNDLKDHWKHLTVFDEAGREKRKYLLKQKNKDRGEKLIEFSGDSLHCSHMPTCKRPHLFHLH